MKITAVYSQLIFQQLNKSFPLISDFNINIYGSKLKVT